MDTRLLSGALCIRNKNRSELVWLAWQGPREGPAPKAYGFLSKLKLFGGLDFVVLYPVLKGVVFFFCGA